MGKQVNLLVQPRQPIPGVLDFGQAGVGVFPEVEDTLVLLRGLLAPFAWFQLKLTFDRAAIYHPQRWDEAKSAP
jgi:hypothetical protein